MRWLKRYQDGRRAALARHGIDAAPPPVWPDDPPPQPQWDDDPVPQPEWNGPRESGDPAPRPHEDAGAAARVAELEAQLAGLQEELRGAHETHEKDDRLIKELQGMVDQDQTHTAELEALAEQLQIERDQLIEVLKLPGAKNLLREKYSPDKRHGATEDVKRAFTEHAQKINVAYDLIKQDERAKKSDDEAA